MRSLLRLRRLGSSLPSPCSLTERRLVLGQPGDVALQIVHVAIQKTRPGLLPGSATRPHPRRADAVICIDGVEELPRCDAAVRLAEQAEAVLAVRLLLPADIARG